MKREKIKYEICGYIIGTLPYILIGVAMIFIYGGRI